MGQSFEQTYELRPSGKPTGNGSSPSTVVPSRQMHGDLIETWKLELDEMRAQISQFYVRELDQVLAEIAGHAGRLSEIRAQLYRINSQACTVLRTHEVDPLREDLDLQFKIASRRISYLEFDFKLSGGGV